MPEKRKTRHGKELTLVLDLDETLVHCTVDPIANPDHRFEVHFNGEEFQVSAYTKGLQQVPGYAFVVLAIIFRHNEAFLRP